MTSTAFPPASGARAAARSSVFSPASAACRAGCPSSTSWRKAARVIVPSLPGFPGGDRGHSRARLPSRLVLAVRELLVKADLIGADLAGSSVGGSLAAEIAAIWPDAVRRSPLIAPFGLFDESDPPTDPWAQRADQVPGLMCADPEIWKALKSAAGGRQLHRVADRADPRERGRGAHLLAARQHQDGEATGADQGADAAVLGRTRQIMPRSYADRSPRASAAGQKSGDRRRGSSRRTRPARRRSADRDHRQLAPSEGGRRHGTRSGCESVST